MMLPSTKIHLADPRFDSLYDTGGTMTSLSTNGRIDNINHVGGG